MTDGILEDFDPSELPCDGNSAKDGMLEDFGHSELPCNENSLTDGMLEDFDPSELPCDENSATDGKLEASVGSNFLYAENSKVLENFSEFTHQKKQNYAESESSYIMIENFYNAGLQKPSETSYHESTELSKDNLEENKVNSHPPKRLRGFYAIQDFPLGCGRKPIKVLDSDYGSTELSVEDLEDDRLNHPPMRL